VLTSIDAVPIGVAGHNLSVAVWLRSRFTRMWCDARPALPRRRVIVRETPHSWHY